MPDNQQPSADSQATIHPPPVPKALKPWLAWLAYLAGGAVAMFEAVRPYIADLLPEPGTKGAKILGAAVAILAGVAVRSAHVAPAPKRKEKTASTP